MQINTGQVKPSPRVGQQKVSPMRKPDGQVSATAKYANQLGNSKGFQGSTKELQKHPNVVLQLQSNQVKNTAASQIKKQLGNSTNYSQLNVSS